MKDDSIVYLIANAIVYIVMFVLCAIAVLNIFDNIIFRIILLVLSLFICGYIEEKILSIFINNLVDFLIKDI